MRKVFAALAVAVLTQASAAPAQQKDVMAVLHQFVDGLNKGDLKSALATCADQASIIDEFAPYEWHGAGACATWANAFDADSRKNGITDGVVTLGKPTHVDITGDNGYVVTPVTYAFKQKGRPMKETASKLIVSLHKSAAGWRITAWTWAKN